MTARLYMLDEKRGAFTVNVRASLFLKTGNLVSDYGKRKRKMFQCMPMNVVNLS